MADLWSFPWRESQFGLSSLGCAVFWLCCSCGVESRVRPHGEQPIILFDCGFALQKDHLNLHLQKVIIVILVEYFFLFWHLLEYVLYLLQNPTMSQLPCQWHRH